MSEYKYSVGIDFGSESGRAVLVRLSDGKEMTEHVTPYSHGVLTDQLPHKDIKLGYEWALQNPDDYIEVIEKSVPKVITDADVNPETIIGIGIDFTASTILPVDASNTPLCQLPEFRDDPHSWVKLWKHHAAQEEANQLNKLAMEKGEEFLSRYGGKISSEWMIPKIMEIANKAPHIYKEADRFIEATDWVVAQLTGELKKNSCTAGYKAIWNKSEGYPGKDFFLSLHPLFENIDEKLRGQIYPLGTKAGNLTDKFQKLTGLSPNTAVAVGNVDAHSSVPAMGVVSPGKMVMVMGTSICHMVLGEEERYVEGMCGVVEDGIIPDYFGYEAGQSAVGDIFGWFVNEQVPASVREEARKNGENVHSWLERNAAEYQPGESGLLALDWWNGNRSVLVDTELSGMLVGMTLQTKPEEVYRALLEATAFGTRKIVDAFHENGVNVDELYACGGLPQKNELLMQIYADVTNRTITIADSTQTPALGAALFGAVAAGRRAGGFDTVLEAASVMGRVKEKKYNPNQENVEIYNQLYKEYERLHDYFGRGENDVMKRLKEIQKRSGQEVFIQ
ncbi:ribulokinase [Halobacillus halophilus]|uniref:ribulokinase n=1 Tax=Halobacillus halophilus TaxID=1570 RepID=UPI001CD58343|nr:ribulokinase [Halobacillus halophilus]MCA1011430.1 ribulokinase [Halobacillus halophilus]